MATESALELDVPTAEAGVEVHFSNFPGLWAPGRPIAVAALGFATADDAAAAVDELGLPLKAVEVDQGSAPMPARDNHISHLSAGPSHHPTHESLNEAIAAAGAEWPRAKMTVADKVAFLEQLPEATQAAPAGGDS